MLLTKTKWLKKLIKRQPTLIVYDEMLGVKF